ncbi:MAG TPA: S8 family serine peptidase [Mycobacteriales bacterium]|nr:S8 family serine peptidase [Mycobacteriales bacterium]
MSLSGNSRTALIVAACACTALGLLPGVATAAPSTSAGPANTHVIVLLRNQHTNLPARGAHRAERRRANAADQKPLLARARQSGGKNLHSYSLVNGFAATVPAAEVGQLAADPSVAAIVPDRLVHLPTVSRPDAVGTSSVTPAALPAGTCPTSPDTPLLEPEALALTHTAFADPRTPQAHNLATGRGVKVGFIADGIDIGNPDLTRPDGTPVIADYQDFSGDGLDAPTSGAEAFGDASAIAAQGLQTYDLNDYSAGSPVGCTIRVQGVAPDATLVALKGFGHSNNAPTSALVQAIDYAVTVANVDVLNESFGANPFPDLSTDPISLADSAAVAAGVTVVASSGDAGTSGTNGSPSTNPDVISAGATTMFQSYFQTRTGGIQFAKNFASDNISALSSGGVTQRGRVVDLVAPGDLGWALCTPNLTLFTGCASFRGTPASVQDFGGTSQSSPLAAGAAALVIQSYQQTHGGAKPTPALVKQILTSTATDLGHPADEQGAGLLNTLDAVRAARSVPDANGTPAPQGSALLVTPTQSSVTGQPGSTHTVRVRVSNDGAITQTVSAAPRSLTRTVSDVHDAFAFDGGNPARTFVDGFGSVRAVATRKFRVPAGADRLVASLAWPGNASQSPMRLALVDPNGTYQAFSLPQGSGNFGHVAVRAPAAGRWTAVFFCLAGASGFTGTVSFEARSLAYQPFGRVSPSTLRLAPGASGSFGVRVTVPSQPGDTSAAVELTTPLRQRVSVPLTVRGLVPVAATRTRFHGTIAGGNGRGGAPAQSATYQLDVPAGHRDLDLGVRLTDPNQTVFGYLLAPDGELLSAASNVVVQRDGTERFTPDLQVVRRDPAAGRWTFLLDVTNPVSGNLVSQPFTGISRLDGASVRATGLPAGADTVLPAGQPATVSVRVRNTGVAPEGYVVDGRLAKLGNLRLAPVNPARVPIPNDGPNPAWLVPTETSGLSVFASASIPIDLDVFQNTGEPEVYGPTQGDSASVRVTADELAPGLWFGQPGQVGPFTQPAPTGTVKLTARARTQRFDPAVTSSVGDPWLASVRPAAADTNPLTLEPGQTGTIQVTITPQGTPGTVVRAVLYVDDFSGATASGDELSAIPYSYTIG